MILSPLDNGWQIRLPAPPEQHFDAWQRVLHAAEDRLRTLDAPADGPGPLLALADGALRAGDGWDALSLEERARLMDFLVETATRLLHILHAQRQRRQTDRNRGARRLLADRHAR